MGNEHGTKESTAGFSMERITRNDAIFREANDGIHDAAEEHVEDRDGDVFVPFICECADPNCTEIIRVTLEQYREVRSQPRLFLNGPAIKLRRTDGPPPSAARTATSSSRSSGRQESSQKRWRPKSCFHPSQRPSSVGRRDGGGA